MASLRDKLVWTALCAVDDAVEAACNAPVPPTFGLRLALAYLFSVSDGTRWPYDQFWTVVRTPDPGRMEAANYRRMMAETLLQAIMRSVGHPPAGGGTEALRAYRHRNTPGGDPRKRLAAAVRLEGERKRQEEDPANQYHG